MHPFSDAFSLLLWVTPSYVETVVSWTLTLTKRFVDLPKLHNLGFLFGSKSKVSEKEKVQI